MRLLEHKGGCNAILDNEHSGFQNIQSIQNIVTVKDIYSKLMASAYGASADVKELGAMLREWYRLDRLH
jgi:hypothetical protein